MSVSSQTGLLSKQETIQVIEAMGKLYPQAKTELHYENDFQLLIAVILSAQTTDVGVNKVTPALFEAYPNPKLLMEADVEDIREKIKTIGLYRNKGKYIQACAKKLVKDFNGIVPDNRKDLESLPGVGRKTANVVLSVIFDKPEIAVDTHVERISKKLRIVPQNASVRETEEILKKKLPSTMWGEAHHRMIFFGRYQCPARTHDHSQCLKKLNEQMETPLFSNC